MIALDALEVLFAHIRQCDEIAVKERHAIVVILNRQALPHARRHLVDEAEIAAIAARADAVEDSGSKLHAELLVVVLVEGKDFLLAVRMLDEQLDLLLRESEAQIDDIAQFLSVDGENLVTCRKLKLLRQASRQHAYDFP